MILQTLKDTSFWSQTVRNDPRYQEHRQLLEQTYLSKRYEEIPTLSYHNRALFYQTGDRSMFEMPYFRRRHSLSVAAMLALIYPEREEYLTYVSDMLWAICDEYTWAVPAHTKGTLENDLVEIDLFNAETGFTLAEIHYVLGERLPRLVRDRVAAEVKRRIFEPFSTRISWFEKLNSNWAAVCGGSVGGAMLYLDPTLLEQCMPRILKALEQFIDGFSDEGVCMEGFSYWMYGFSAYLWFADLLHAHTNGKIDLLAGEKVEHIAGYLQSCFMKGNVTVSFSDGTPHGHVSPAVQNYLAKRFPHSVSLMPKECCALYRGNVFWLPFSREIIYCPDPSIPASLQLKNHDFPLAQQVIVHEEGYSLFAKAGHNDEQHNHNDVGSFILSTERYGQVLCDIGGGRYTKKYFQGGMENRYSILCNSSLGHSVPIVNGQPQLCGRAYYGSIEHNGDCIRIEMATAYGQREITKLTRTLTHKPNKMILTDEFLPTYQTLVERFVTRIVPSVEKDCVLIGNVRMEFDPEEVTVNVQEKAHQNHAGTFDPVYCIDCEVRSNREHVTVTFCVVDE